MGEVTWSGGWGFLCPDTYPLAKRKLVYNPRKSRRTVESLRGDTFPPMFLCLVSDRFYSGMRPGLPSPQSACILPLCMSIVCLAVLVPDFSDSFTILPNDEFYSLGNKMMP